MDRNLISLCNFTGKQISCYSLYELKVTPMLLKYLCSYRADGINNCLCQFMQTATTCSVDACFNAFIRFREECGLKVRLVVI